MTHLYQSLADKTREWKKADYPSDFPTIAEILQYQTDPETGFLRFLREPQMRALETYWYLRLVENTPHIFDLYKRTYTGNRQLREALGVTTESIRDYVEDYGIEALWERIKTDSEFVGTHSLQALHETLTLDYSSYILALAMGAGKTILIGTIIATEFAMALEYPDADFVENALVFAPGKTIIESLRELSQVPYEKILPPRLYKDFEANLKLAFTRDGEMDVPVIRGSTFNVVVTNTEKIRIQKQANRTRARGWTQLQLDENEKRDEEVANRRLKTIASLPNLAVFSDEAHHTYGIDVEKGLKRVRQTVDYLAANTRVICVVNTTGTPYYGKQLLKDVVIWYGLAEGIADGILKEVEDSIQSYRFDTRDANDLVTDVVKDFFKDYADVRLPNGASAKLAIYFPKIDDLNELRSAVEAALVAAGQSPSIALSNTSESAQEEVDRFNRLNDPATTDRVVLLVNKGTEGWNCPSLFACALVRKLTTSSNFILQAATRCLRQVPGNKMGARIYISDGNRHALDSQLQETYGETISSLNKAERHKNTAVLTLHKRNPPPLILTIPISKVTRTASASETMPKLVKPQIDAHKLLEKTIYDLDKQAGSKSVLRAVDDIVVAAQVEAVDLYTASVRLANIYRLDVMQLKKQLVTLYADEGEIPEAHLADLARQIEEQTCHYETTTQNVEVALAIVKPEGWLDKKTGQYTTTINYGDEKKHLIVQMTAIRNLNGFGFHYFPYNFDSVPEHSFFKQMIDHLNLHPDDVEDIYYTGAITDPAKTDFFIEYRDNDGKPHRYTPDFLIRLKPKGDDPPGFGKCLIVEIKSEQHESVIKDERAKGKAVSSEGLKVLATDGWAKLHADRLKYDLIFAPAGELLRSKTDKARDFVEGGR